MTTSKSTRGLTLAALLTASFVVLGAPTAGAHAPSASARTVPSIGSFRIENDYSEYCLEVDDDGDVYTSPCDRSDDRQLWDSSGDGTQLRNVQTGYCMEDLENGDVSGVTCADTDAQRWEHGEDRWLKNWGTGSCLAEHGLVYIASCADQASERWELS